MSHASVPMLKIYCKLPELAELPDHDIITRWLEEKHGIHEQFAQAIWQMYFDKLVRLAHTELGGLPRSDEDEEDVALSALASFLRGAGAGRYPQLADPKDLWRLLFTITARKAMARKRRFFAQKRGGGGVRNQADLDEVQDFNELLGKEPTQELAREMVETCFELLDDLHEPELKSLALYKMEAYTNDEIALLLKCSLRTVNRRLERIRALWTNKEIH